MWIRRASHRPAGPLAEVKPPPKATPIAVHVKERASERDRKRHGETSVAAREVGPARTDSNPCASGRRPEMHYVAAGAHVFLAFQAQPAGIAGAGFAAERHIVLIGDGL